jgi:hypothetical protein
VPTFSASTSMFPALSLPENKHSYHVVQVSLKGTPKPTKTEIKKNTDFVDVNDIESFM